METNDRYRYELKYQCSEPQMAIIQSRLLPLMRIDSHTINGRYMIRSMYFDNCENRCYYENESGVDPREKFRIRIYNADGSRIALECKRKERGKTHKEQYAALLNGGELCNLPDAPALLRRFSILARSQLFRPAVIVEYERTPFVYGVGGVRITLDRNIRSSNSFAGFFDDAIPARPILPPGQHLLEVKYDELLPGFIKDALQLGNLQQTAFSKYYLCRKHALGGQP